MPIDFIFARHDDANNHQSMKERKSRRRFLVSSIIAATGMLPLRSSARNTHPMVDQDRESNEKDLTFLFQGDSITDGNRGRSWTLIILWVMDMLLLSPVGSARTSLRLAFHFTTEVSVEIPLSICNDVGKMIHFQ